MKKFILLVFSTMIAGILLFAGCASDGNILDTEEKTEFVVTFDANRGILQDLGEITVQKDDRITLPMPTRNGYIFCGWFIGDNKWTAYDKVTSNVTLTAKWLSKMANSGNVFVKFDRNDGSGTILKTVGVDQDGYIKATDLPEEPTRDGYYFAGWHTRSEIKKSDLIGGVSKYLYYAGESKSAIGSWDTEVKSTFDPVCQIENLTSNGSATLYARWVQEKEITTEKELNEIRNDLYGAYKLSADIHLTNEWQPIGSYYSNYELYETNWWVHAFRGSFEGNNHNISGLSFTDMKGGAEDGLHLLVQEGKYGIAVSGLFGCIVDNASIKNVTIQRSIIKQDITGGAYIGTIVGFMQGGRVDNVKALNSDIDLTSTDSGYASVTGFVGGFWAGTISSCRATGDINYIENRQSSDTGELFVGGISGECYSLVENCNSEYSINVTINDESVATNDGHLQVSIGGLSGANCYLKDCTTNSEIFATVGGSSGKVTVRTGLAVGIERYGYIRGCNLRGSIQVKTENCGQDVNVYKGSILGGFDFSTFAIIGPMFDPELSVRYIENNITSDGDSDVVGEPGYEGKGTFTYVIENNTVSAE